ncbi:MAG TPA: anti-sigma factor [Nitrospirales bacterium]|nr:anti-sigma factor [Nitrospirales bacterium]
MDHEQLEENLSLYALGALDPDSVYEMEQHLAAGCSACSTLLRQYQAAVTSLPYALPPQTPPSALKSRIMTALSGPAASTISVRADKPASPVPIPTAPPDLVSPRASSWVPQDLPEKPAPQHLPGRSEFLTWQDQLRVASPALATALGALLLGVGGYAASLYNTLEAERTATARDRAEVAKSKLEIADLKSQLEDKQAALTKATTEMKRALDALGTTHELLTRRQEQIETLQVQLKTGRGPKDRYRTDVVQAGNDDLVRILTSPTAKMASLSGTVKAKEAYAMIFVEPGTGRGFFYANNLPFLPAGMTYQLWVITDKPISAGVFTLDPGHKGRLLLRGIPDVSLIKKFAVSLEPEGGHPKPTGSIYLVGAL